MIKIALLGSGIGDVPIVKAAKKMGFFVYTISKNKNGVVHKYSDEYVCADYTDTDEILSVINKHNIKYVIPGGNDKSYLTCASLAQKKDIGNFDNFFTAEILHAKHLFKIFALNENISVPEGGVFNDIQKALNYILEFKSDAVVKPSDSTSGWGVEKIFKNENINSKKEKIFNAFKSSSIKKIVIEKFINGSNHAISVIIKNRKVFFYFVDDEYYYLNPYKVAGAMTDVTLDKKVIIKIIKEIETIADKLRLKDGLLHVQFMVENDKPYIIELCRRTPGDLYVELVRLSTSVDYAEIILKFWLGLNDIEIKQKDKKLIVRHCVMANKNGQIESYAFQDNMKVVKNVLLSTDIKDYLNENVAIVFFECNSKEKMKKIDFNKAVKLKYKD